MKKRKTLILLVLFLLISTVIFAEAKTEVNKEQTSVILYINNKEVTFPDAQPFIVRGDDRTLVPIRFVAEDLGYKVDWDEENWFKGGNEDKKVTITNEGKTMELFIGQNYAYINGERKEYDTKPLIDGSRTFVPLRFIAENFDCEVDYKHNVKQKIMKIYITTKDGVKIPEEPDDSNIVAQGEGWDTRLVEVKGHDDNWIEPEIIGGYPPKDADLVNCHFSFGIKNYKDYEGTNYTFKTECISHPQLNKYIKYDPWDDEDFIVDNIEMYTRHSENLIDFYGTLYSLRRFNRDADNVRDIKTGERIHLKEGEKMQFKTTISNGKMTKVYITNAEFRNKEFRYN
ncbi:copper amine oxidase-like protein [Keratinibaculum paraultunense]|uniref:Copper amine oxidase-like protein n=1 Tax=Keratinibaculum paraultunense TaxID=1278232 RepID=A0A4R3KTW3_9FIRM|nr:copper amine oxidase N-terminal domain-containing protein [Keratinibaculum paraultunense]QQY79899.1 copper amine oxidase N-terminal domain-containing protein [Keratinibaculum paraultunense]TCS88789.1 copper amine oxidase-like protein [Keratinibaculum paraultunense]